MGGFAPFFSDLFAWLPLHTSCVLSRALIVALFELLSLSLSLSLSLYIYIYIYIYMYVCMYVYIMYFFFFF